MKTWIYHTTSLLWGWLPSVHPRWHSHEKHWGDSNDKTSTSDLTFFWNWWISCSPLKKKKKKENLSKRVPSQFYVNYSLGRAREHLSLWNPLRCKFVVVPWFPVFCLQMSPSRDKKCSLIISWFSFQSSWSPVMNTGNYFNGVLPIDNYYWKCGKQMKVLKLDHELFAHNCDWSGCY